VNRSDYCSMIRRIARLSLAVVLGASAMARGQPVLQVATNGWIVVILEICISRIDGKIDPGICLIETWRSRRGFDPFCNGCKGRTVSVYDRMKGLAIGSR
jgi:hypothetical protein